MSKTQTFKDRLYILMNGDRPYSWSKKVGIEKGLFQYYWQKGNIPTFENLLKIQRYSGCSLDWLLTGRVVDAFGSIENLATKNSPLSTGRFGLRAIDTVRRVSSLYKTADEKTLELLEGMIEALEVSSRKAPAGSARRAAATQRPAAVGTDARQ